MNQILMKRTAISLSLILGAITMLVAQVKQPSWTQKEPNKKDSYIGIVQTQKPTPMDTIPFDPNYKVNAVRNALWKVASQMPWEIDASKSLFAILSNKGAYKSSLDNVLLAEMQKSPYFQLEGEWESETEYWCYVSVKKDNAKQFIDQMVEDTKAKAKRIYDDAKKLQSEGYVYRAAKMYAEALDSLHPAIFRYLPISDETEMVDLGWKIYDSYTNVYKGIAMTTEVKSIPAVHGEGVPGSYSVLVTQNGVPLRKLGIITTYDGVVTSSPTTNDEGCCIFSIDNVTSKEAKQTVNFTIDVEYLMDLPTVYGCNVLEGTSLFPSLKVPINLFNPKELVKINTVSTDSLLRLNLTNLWNNNRDEMELIERFDSADVVVEVDAKVVKEKDVPTGKYNFVQHNASLEITVKGVKDDVILTQYAIKDFKIILPASRTEAQVRQSALREMIRQMNREFANSVKNYKFDKREMVWRSLTVIND